MSLHGIIIKHSDLFDNLPFQSLWKKLEQFKNTEFPACVKSLLTNAGYDTIMSLTSLDEAKIQQIEVFFNANKYYINKLQCCYSDHYKQLEVFEFLPGHKTLILELSNLIREFQSHNAEKSAENQKKKILSISDYQLKEKLIQKLARFLRKDHGNDKIEFPSDTISDANIHDFTCISQDDFKWKCRFSCPFCSKSYSIIYKKQWMASIVTKHLGNHLESYLKANNKDSTNQ